MANRGVSSSTLSRRRAKQIAGGALAAIGTTIVGVIAADLYQGTRESLSAPLSVQVTSASDCPAGSYVVPKVSLPKSADPGTVESEWAYSTGGLDRDPVYFLTVQGDTDKSVVLQSLDVVEVNQVTPPPNAVTFNTCVGGGDVFPRRFEARVAETGSRVEPLSGDKEIPMDGADPAPRFPYKVSATDPEVFWVTVTTECYCEWKLRLEWTSGSRAGSTDVTLGGKPFRTAPGIFGSGGPKETYSLTPQGRVVRSDS